MTAINEYTPMKALKILLFNLVWTYYAIMPMFVFLLHFPAPLLSKITYMSLISRGAFSDAFCIQINRLHGLGDRYSWVRITKPATEIINTERQGVSPPTGFKKSNYLHTSTNVETFKPILLMIGGSACKIKWII